MITQILVATKADQIELQIAIKQGATVVTSQELPGATLFTLHTPNEVKVLTARLDRMEATLKAVREDLREEMQATQEQFTEQEARIDRVVALCEGEDIADDQDAPGVLTMTIPDHAKDAVRLAAMTTLRQYAEVKGRNADAAEEAAALGTEGARSDAELWRDQATQAANAAYLLAIYDAPF